MFASPQTRRITRTTRITQKDNENANARPSRITTRNTVKPLSSTGAAAARGGVTAATAASKAKAADSKADPAAGKRKREALGEVTTALNNKGKGKAAVGKGKDVDHPTKEKFDGVVIKTTKAISTTTTVRQGSKPLSTSRRPAAKALVQPAVLEEVAEVQDEHAMAIDDHTIINRRVSTRSAGTSRRVIAVVEEDEEEASRVTKKPRPSSEAPQSAAQTFEEQLQQVSDAASADFHAINEEEPEADPEGDDWTDLDAEDADDPLMVSEYVVEIFKYMKEIEQTTMPNPLYMDSQKELAWSMRGILTDWLVQVHVRFRLMPETLFLCVNIIDRFLSARVVSLAKLQLVGITCLFIASKVEEIVSPSVSHFLYCADSSYTESEILMAERYVLKTLDWNLSYPNPIHYLRRVSKADEYDVKARTIAKYLLEIGCLEWRLLSAPPSLMAAASIWLARLILDHESWTPNLAHYSSYAESSIVPVANIMLNYVLKPIKHESFYKKYAGKRYLKSSVWVREWALERWAEGTQVVLSEELPALKAQIRVTRAAQEEQEA
ncbi:hypothetical protein HWV62_27319 [Athelia sp. TMB]|nr:hypothetical protein HWV62_27319 [Athelia sp. TMB]